ncbi:MAG TPA: hypothetical protein VIV60_25740, partial [Polyangiaceae bacterium]
MTGLYNFGRLGSAIVEKSANVDDFVGRLREICEGTALAFALRVGHLVIETFCEGNIEVWRSRGVAQTSLRA